ncbi:hypothetical protein [Paenibacillus sp. IHBB 10380]|uniref:hypothetical protein n=1 Tax=Paenibacillus sp. IHBB 10380 TaxID=1566358 RepID=UPI0005CFCD84|nr:hypothetical protein [Paenibacillus sp. IHBB 10380]AJS60875.1 hypothetical protein UB51_23195 [Paenibacillus sp. IHBB 10380]
MNHQLIFKKLALSALLVSAIAAPTVTNAASEPKTVSPEALSKVVTTPAANVLTTTFIMSSWANPLELVTTYSPNSLEDWQKTLEQYKKVAEETNNMPFFIEMDKANIELDQAFEINIDDAMDVESTIATSIIAVEGDVIISGIASETGVLGHFSEADQAFFKAQIALNDASKSKDAIAIKEALAELLVQYKQQIADFETAK